MAYPFTKLPSLGEFLATAASYGVTVNVSPTEVVGPRGKITFRYARRNDGSPGRHI
jgi:hypothetical protein